MEKAGHITPVGLKQKDFIHNGTLSRGEHKTYDKFCTIIKEKAWDVHFSLKVNEDIHLTNILPSDVDFLFVKGTRIGF